VRVEVCEAEPEGDRRVRLSGLRSSVIHGLVVVDGERVYGSRGSDCYGPEGHSERVE